MKKFTTIPEAFDWWIKNIYPSLPPDVKKGRPVTAWRDYTHKRGISEERMRGILLDYGHFKITTSITYEP
ncbi:hypothetical protein [Salmonirosea aquatica]|uniref:Uncharacterized protein n=1 Tax=Salmonirosea aquatica TaxID=2654236 RepID=A0A7C9FZH7_9BACT|nr:hypothetical protein [Cytophagaceae bacterium SJW1-29]